MSFLPVLLALGVILIFATIVFLAIRASRNMTAEKVHLARTLGFEIAPTLPINLANRAEELFQIREDQAITLENVFSRRELDQEFFIFDLHDSSEDDSAVGKDVFGVISRELALPRFSLTTLPGFNSEGLLGGLMEKLLDKILALAGKYQGLSRIEFPDQPEIGDQLIVFGRDEFAVRELLRGIHLDTLITNQSPIHIAGNGDFLTVDFSIPYPSSSTESDLISQYQQFTQIVRTFMK